MARAGLVLGANSFMRDPVDLCLVNPRDKVAGLLANIQGLMAEPMQECWVCLILGVDLTLTVLLDQTAMAGANLPTGLPG